MYDQVILLTGMPRSGTSWLSQIFDSSPLVRFRLSPLFSYEFKNSLNEDATPEEWATLLQRVYAANNDFMNQTQRRNTGQYPTFLLKETAPPVLVIKDTRFHNLTLPMLKHVADLKVVSIVRHPCGAIHSWLTASREFPAQANPLQEWRTGQCRKTGYGEFWGFEDWKAVTRLHLELAATMPEKFIIQRYEDLTKNASEETRKLFSFCGITCDTQTEEFLYRSQQESIEGEYAVFKKPETAERWRNELQSEVRDAILAELHGTDLERFTQ